MPEDTLSNATVSEDKAPQDAISGAPPDSPGYYKDLVGEGYTMPDPVDPETVPWEFDISDADFKKLQVGFRSFESDDKWHFVATGPDEAGNIRFHIIRIFSRMVFFTFYIKPRDGDGDGDGTSGRYKVHSFTWEKGVCIPETEEEAKEHAAILCINHLRCVFEELPYYDLFRGELPERVTREMPPE